MRNVAFLAAVSAVSSCQSQHQLHASLVERIRSIGETKLTSTSLSTLKGARTVICLALAAAPKVAARRPKSGGLFNR